MNGFDAALLLLRVVIGLVLIAHGYNHAFRGGRLPGTAGWFQSLGMRPGWVHARVATVTEFVAGVLMILGLFTPFAAAGFVGVMAVAGITAHRGNGFFIFKPGQGWEYVLVLGTAAATLGGTGPGQVSLDYAFDIVIDDWAGFLIALGLGLGGTALLLATAWRPNKTEA